MLLMKIAFIVWPLLLAICVLLLAVFGFGLTMGLGGLINYLSNDQTAGGWVWMLSIPAVGPSIIGSMPWSQEFSNLGENQSVIAGVFINGSILQGLWLILLISKKLLRKVLKNR